MDTILKAPGLAVIGLCSVVYVCPVQCGGRQYLSGEIVDSGEYDWCHYDCQPFDRPTYFFCVRVQNRLLIGSRAADWSWMYDSSRMLGRNRPVSLRYDDHSIWIIRTDGKEMHLKTDYSHDVFGNPECTAAVHRRWLKELESVDRPKAVPAGAVLVPQGERPPIPLFYRTGPYFWVTCKLEAAKGWDLCERWDEKGASLGRLEAVNAENHMAVLPNDLVIDPLTTRVYYEIHLRNGVVLKDWARGRINDEPSSDSIPPKPIHTVQ